MAPMSGLEDLQTVRNQSESARFDSGLCGVTCSTRQDHSGIDWNENAKMIVIGLDREGNVTQWNERARELTDFAQHEVFGFSFARRLISYPFAGLVDGILRRTWDGENVGSFQIPFFTKSGTRLQLVVRAFCALCGSSEHLLFKAFTAEDIAIQRVGCQRAVMNVHVDLDGHVTEWDAGAQHISGFTRDEMLGQDFLNVVISAHARAPLEHAFMRALMRMEHRLTSSIPFYTKAGREKWLLFRTFPRYQARGEQMTGQLTGVKFVANVAGAPGEPYDPSEPGKPDPESVPTCDTLPFVYCAVYEAESDATSSIGRVEEGDTTCPSGAMASDNLAEARP